MPKIEVSELRPGDVVAVPLGNRWLGFVVWLQALFTMKSNVYGRYGHIAVYHHEDAAGRKWAIEAAPHGIGWRDISSWDGHFGLTNVNQPKTDEQRGKIISMLEELIGSRYDYSAYLHFALESIGITPLWIREYDGEKLPASFVCSAVADFIYEVCLLDNPGGDKETRFTTPAEWARFMDRREWEH